MSPPPIVTRRQFAAAASWAAVVSWRMPRGAAHGQLRTAEASVEVLYPRDRIPLSFIIDDSTSLVNMGHFCMPQFAETFPERAEYQKPWQTWPREIPDRFLSEFGEWCAANQVRGKFSMVPYPACVGWLDRELPGWSRRDLQASLALVRDLIVPSWDIHPEMITHTRVIDLKTGRPLPSTTPDAMENWFPEQEISTDQLAAYLAYALRILRECGLPCEGVTTPGGFGSRVRDRLPQAVHESVRDVFAAELPHYFKDVVEGPDSTMPVVPPQSAPDSIPPQAISVISGTGDWFGGWDGVTPMESHRYVSLDGQSGRMVELIERGEPAVMLCHWPGLYNNGSAEGFHEFQRIVVTLRERFGQQTQWLKLSEIARWAAARSWTRTTVTEGQLQLTAPLSCPAFTLAMRTPPAGVPISLRTAQQTWPLSEVQDRGRLTAGSWCRVGERYLICFDLPKGQSTVHFG